MAMVDVGLHVHEERQHGARIATSTAARVAPAREREISIPPTLRGRGGPPAAILVALVLRKAMNGGQERAWAPPMRERHGVNGCDQRGDASSGSSDQGSSQWSVFGRRSSSSRRPQHEPFS